MPDEYSYKASIKSDRSDELINVVLMRPLAGIVVRLVYPTRITPNHLTFMSVAAGILAAWCISFESGIVLVAAAILIEVKDILDSADGQLARAKQLSSRRGRFYDSLGDVAVNAALFCGIAARFGFDPSVTLLALAGFAGMTLRVSYHVFYQVMFLHLGGSYGLNRADEAFTGGDREADGLTRLLQRLHLIVYGWQDRLMASIDAWCLANIGGKETGRHQTVAELWYGDPVGLRLSGMIGLATELALLSLCTIFDSLPVYLWLNLIVMNAVWAASVIYRRRILSRQIRVSFVEGTLPDEGNPLPRGQK